MNFALRHSRYFSFALLIAVVGGFSGCRKSATDSRRQGGSDPKEDAIASAVNRLERDDDPATCREVLATIDASPSPRDPKPEPTPEQIRRLQALLNLDKGEADILASPVFVAADAEHLVDCFLLRDAAESLDLEGYPEADKAALAFRWVCRQIYLSRGPSMPAPAWWVLQAGSGSGLDRAYVFVQLLHQLGIDGCLIGPPALARTPSVSLRESGDQVAIAPVRAVGARVGKDVLLFDPWTGTQVMKGDKPATLAEVREQPEAFEKWLSEAMVKPEEAKRWQAFLAVPLPAIEPRMAWLEKQIPAANVVRLAVDPAALAARFADGGLEATFWNAPRDGFSLPRLQLTFGQEVRGEKGEVVRPYQRKFRADHFPLQFMPVPQVGGQPLTGEPLRMLEGFFNMELASMQIAPKSPRDNLLRGNFSNAVSALADLKERSDSTRDRTGGEKVTQADIDKWSAEANRLYAESIRAEERGDSIAAVKAKADQANFLRSPTSEKIAVIVRRRTSTLLAAETGYQLALIMHERAARADARLRHQPSGKLREEAHNLWRTADDSWNRFESDHKELKNGYPDRQAHAEKLHAECKAGLERTGKK